MKRFIEGEERSQITLLPECLDDYIADENPVRVVDVFVDELKLRQLGFDGAVERSAALFVNADGVENELRARQVAVVAR
jgi:transposase